MKAYELLWRVTHGLTDFETAICLAALCAEGCCGNALTTNYRKLSDLTLKQQTTARQAQRVISRLEAIGLLRTMVHERTSTTIQIVPAAFERLLDAAPAAPPAAELDRFIRVLHGRRSYDDAVVMCGLMTLLQSASGVGPVALGDLAVLVRDRLDRFKVHRSVKRLWAGGWGLVEMSAVPRSGTRLRLVPGAAVELLAKPLPAVRYLLPDAFANQPFFVERARRALGAVRAVDALAALDGVIDASAVDAAGASGCAGMLESVATTVGGS